MASFSRAGSRAASKINEIQVKDAMVMDNGGLRSNSESLTGGFCRQPYALVDKIPQSGTTGKYLASDGEILDGNTFSANSRTCKLLKNAE
jgi:hypothetical protein